MEIDPLRDLARTARKLPGYRNLRRTLVPRIRRNKVARMVAHRIFGSGGRRGGGADLSAGTVLDGVGTERLPVVVIMITGATDQRCRRIVEQVATAQLLGAGFKPWFVLDSPVFAPFRSYGYAVDLLVARDAWASADRTWEEYVGHRLARLVATFAAAATVRIDGDELSPIDAALLSDLGDRPVLPMVAAPEDKG